LERIATDPPDVVLLDLQMPRMDGFEMCRRLKSNPATASIPVLMVTALSERDDRLEGIRAGANDLVTKPVDSTDLVLRVRNALHMRGLYTRLDRQLVDLRRLEALRDDLMHMLVHDLRAPLTSLSVSLQLAAAEVDPSGSLKESLVDATQSTRRLGDMVSDILDLGRMEAGELPLERVSFDLRSVCEGAIAATLTAGSRVRIVRDWPPDAADIVADATLISRVVANLVDNAVKFSPPDQPVRLALEPRRGAVRLTVEDCGPGVPEEARRRIFDKYGQAGRGLGDRRSSGLGLAFCRLAVEAHGGTVGVDEAPGGGSRFWFDIPVAAE
jgi:signal transduction histidine kinase